MVLTHRQTSWILSWTTHTVPSWTFRSFIVKKRTSWYLRVFMLLLCRMINYLKIIIPHTGSSSGPIWTKDQPRTSMCPTWSPAWLAQNRATAQNTTCQPLLFKTFPPSMITPPHPSGPTPISCDNCPSLQQRSFSMTDPQPLSPLPTGWELPHPSVQVTAIYKDSQITSLTLTLLMIARPQFLIDY